MWYSGLSIMLGNLKESSKSGSRPGCGSSSGSGSGSGSSKSQPKSAKSESGNKEGWPNWEWHDDYQCEWRSREKSKGTYVSIYDSRRRSKLGSAMCLCMLYREVEYDYRYPNEGDKSTPHNSAINTIIEEEPGETEHASDSQLIYQATLEVAASSRRHNF